MPVFFNILFSLFLILKPTKHLLSFFGGAFAFVKLIDQFSIDHWGIIQSVNRIQMKPRAYLVAEEYLQMIILLNEYTAN